MFVRSLNILPDDLDLSCTVPIFATTIIYLHTLGCFKQFYLTEYKITFSLQKSSIFMSKQ